MHPCSGLTKLTPATAPGPGLVSLSLCVVIKLQLPLHY